VSKAVGADARAGQARPTLRVVPGHASPEEIAAVVAAVAASAPEADPDASAAHTCTTSVWASRTSAQRQVRATFAPGPHAWRTSFWPR
jgi:Acyl-CoA carboxylase epsilon subunit